MIGSRSAALVLLFATSVAHAHSLGTIFSSPVDGDSAAVAWNPAAMSLATTSRFDLVANGQILSGYFQRAGIDTAQTGRAFPRVSLVSIRPEPVIGVVIDKLWHKRLRLGLSISLPDAAGAAWPRTLYDNGQVILGPTRYHVTSAEIFHVFTQVGAAIALHPTFSLGLSINLVTSYLDVDKDVDLANQPPLRDSVPCNVNVTGCENPTLSAPINLHGTGFSAGATVGFLWQPIQQVRVGVSYQSPVVVPVGIGVTINAQQLSDFARTYVPGFTTISVNGSGTANVTVPQRAQAALAYSITPRFELMGMVRWINYSATEVVSGAVTQRSNSLVPASLSIPSVRNDQWTAILRLVARVKERTKLGFSLEYVNATVPSEYMTPSDLDFNNLSFNLGAQVRVYNRVYLGASFSETVAFTRTITASAYSDQSPVPYNLPNPSGEYGGGGQRVGLDVSALF